MEQIIKYLTAVKMSFNGQSDDSYFEFEEKDMTVELGWAGYEEHDYTTLKISEDSNHISISVEKDSHSVMGGDFDESEIKTFTTPDEVIEFISELVDQYI